MSRLHGTGPLPSPPTITVGCRLAFDGSAGPWAARLVGGIPVSGTASHAANDMLGVPFILESKTTFYKGFWQNGSAAGGNTSIGLYDENYVKLAETASTAGVTNSVPQVAALGSTVTCPPGKYHMVCAHSTATTNQLQRWTLSSLSWAKQAGLWKQASVTLGTLPATATPVAYTGASITAFGLITRSVFDV